MGSPHSVTQSVLKNTIRHDQAEGLRRLLAVPMPSLCTVLFAGDRARKPPLMQRLALSMTKRGRAVLWVDGHSVHSLRAEDSAPVASLLDVAEGRIALAQASTPYASGVHRIALGMPSGAASNASLSSSLSSLLRDLAAGRQSLLVDTELDADGQLPLPVLAEGELVLQVEAEPQAIRDAYQIMRSLKSLCMPGTLALLVCGASPERTRQVQANLFHAASRYLAMPVRAIVAPPASLSRHV